MKQEVESIEDTLEQNSFQLMNFEEEKAEQNPDVRSELRDVDDHYSAQELGSKISETAALGSALAFNPFSSRGKLLTHLAKNKRVLNKY